MLQYEKVLCPIAFHPNCFDALRIARQCVDRESGTLYLLHVVHRVDPFEISAPIIADRQIQDATERLREVINRQLAGITVIPLLRSGAPVREIIEAQKDLNIEIIVLARHNRFGLVKMFIGSVAEHVVRGASCAVLTVHPQLHESESRSE